MTITKTLAVTGTTTLTGAVTFAGNVTLADDDSLILGTGSDLTVVHNGSNTLMTSTTGDLVVDNTNATGSTIMQLGTDTSATDFQVQNNTGAAMLTVDGAGTVTMIPSVAATLTHAADGAGDDFTISQTGAQDASLLLTSAGTGADAIGLTASAGGVSITAAATDPIDCAGNVYQSTVAGAAFLSLGVYDTSGGSKTISAAELIGGYTYVGAANGTATLTFPGADAVQTALAAMGITSAAGLRLPPVFVDVTDDNNLTPTIGLGETVVGASVAINNQSAHLNYVFTSANTAHIFVIKDT